MSRFCLAALASALLAATGPAVAGSMASTSVEIKFHLIDLTPEDGVAPSFSFLDGGNQTSVDQVVDDARRTSASPLALKTSTLGWMSSTSGELTSAGDGAQNTWVVTPNGLSLTGSARGLDGYFEGGLVTSALEDGAYWLRNLALSANSVLNIELSYSLHAEASNAPPCLADALCLSGLHFNTERAGASVGVSLAYAYQEDGLNVSYNRQSGDSVWATTKPRVEVGALFVDEAIGDLVITEQEIPGEDQVRNAAGLLKVSFLNATQQQQLANLRISTSVWGRGNTPAVPEPGAFTLGLIGLGLAALMVKRR